jgi:tyrosine-protein kinase Etk/Wzc
MSENTKTASTPGVFNQAPVSVLTRIITNYVDKWPYFLLAIVVALGAATFYLKRVVPVYEMKASLLILEAKDNPNEKKALQEINMTNPVKQVEIELEVLKSRKLIEKVIKNLNMLHVYEVLKNDEYRELYKTRPFIYKTITSKLKTADDILQVEVTDEHHFQLLNPERQSISYEFGKPFQSNAGTGILEATPYLRQFVGSTINITIRDIEPVITIYQNKLEATLVEKKASIIQLAIEDAVTARGIDFLNYLIGEYKLLNFEEKNRTTENTLTFIDERLSLISGELNAVEKNIEGYKSTRGLTDISSESAIYLQNAQTNDVRLNEVNVQLKVIDDIEKYLGTPGNNAAPSTVGIEDKGLISLIDQLFKLQLERNKLLASTPENSYLFDPINKQLQTTMIAIRENIKNTKSSLLSMKSGLQTVNSRVEASIKSLPGQERGYISIKRQQSIKENLYTYLLQKREEVALSYASTLTDASVIDSAYVNGITWPKKPFIYASALFLAFAFTALVLFMLEVLNNKIVNGHELQQSLVTPVVSELSYIKNTSSMIVLENPKSAIAEQFRSLRTNLRYLHGNAEKGRVTLVTSSKSGEGKSFVSINLGVSLATSGRKTVIIDLDLHKAKLSGIFDLPAGLPGVSDYLNGHASVEEIIQPLGLSNLYIITSGNGIENPSELIENSRLDTLVEYLKTDFEDIILDSPPLHIINDALILSRLNDVSLYVVRKNMTEKSEMNFIDKFYLEDKLPNLNIVFNCVNKSTNKVIY